MSTIQVKTMAEFMAEGKEADILFWVGSAGSFDDRAKKITKAFVQIMNKAGVNFGVLGTEESSSGDAAKRSGNEFLFQMQAMTNIEVMNAGIPAITSFNESNLIKEKLIHYKPDLLIVYDGNNDTSCPMTEHITKDHVGSKEMIIKLCGVYSPDNYDKIYAERWSEI